MPQKQYVLLQGIKSGNRFFTNTHGRPEDEIIRLLDGTVVYTIIGYADTIEEAQTALFGSGIARRLRQQRS